MRNTNLNKNQLLKCLNGVIPLTGWNIVSRGGSHFVLFKVFTSCVCLLVVFFQTMNLTFFRGKLSSDIGNLKKKQTKNHVMEYVKIIIIKFFLCSLII